MSDDEVLLHLDFSKNYNCKYSQEVQSLHFGGSRNQITLHTVVMYYKSKTNDSTSTLNRSLCTLSENPRHDPVAICTHLEPIITEIKKCIPSLSKIHFLSDGPSMQYRNRKMFFLAGTFLSKVLQVKSLHWHFSERGHGKRAPNGIGGCIKRLADNLVAQGKDIDNINKLLPEIKMNSNIDVYMIETKDIEKFESNLPKIIVAFKGTLKVHEVNW